MNVWNTVSVDGEKVLALARAAEIPAPLAAVLVGRGLDSPATVERFLNPRLSDLSDPFLLPDMDKAVHRVWQALDGGQAITVYGDYDADGVTATALLVRVLRALGGNVEPFLPNRFDEGYGLSVKALRRCFQSRVPGLLLTVDCGTCSGDAVRHARECGADVVVTDHHEVAGEPAPAGAVVNPKMGGPEDCRTLAGVGVAFKLAHALVKHGYPQGTERTSALDLRPYLDIVAAGTVADVVPLVGENRILVRHGLQKFSDTQWQGLSALLASASVTVPVDAYHLGFVVGPRLNAAGRMGSPDPALALLLADDADSAAKHAKILEELNRKRRDVEETIFDAALAQVEPSFDPAETFGVVAAGEGWHIGTLGIVASDICGRFRRPAVLIGIDAQGLGRGSGRSLESVDLVEILNRCGDLLEYYGGHKMAAGLTIRKENIQAFRERFNASCRESLDGADTTPSTRVDGWIRLSEADEALLTGLESLKPFGLGNPTPVWGSRGVAVVGRPQTMGKTREHLKMTVACGGSQMEAVAFGMAARTVPEGPMDILYTLQANTYRGYRKLQLNIKDFRSREEGAESP